MILKKFLKFPKSEPRDSYKLKIKSVYLSASSYEQVQRHRECKNLRVSVDSCLVIM